MAKRVILVGQSQRNYAKGLIDTAPVNAVVTIAEATRSNIQSAKMHAMIDYVAGQLKWHGLSLTVDDWKLIFLNGLNAEIRIVPNWNGDGFVNLSRKTSHLTVAKMADMIELIYAYGAKNGVVWSQPNPHSVIQAL
jgi:hypothetical protein